MRLRLFVLSFALTNLSYNSVQYAMTAQSEPRREILSGEDMMRILPGNTLLAYDESGPFWMYYAGPDTVWGQSSSGDVDVGRWWIENGRYCRSWRLWYVGATQCWTLAADGDNRIFWLDDRESLQGESLIWEGNAIGKVRAPLIASAAADIEIDPIAVTGTIGPERRTRFADNSSDRTASSSENGSSGGGSSGGGSSGGGSSGGGSSGGGSSGGGDGSGSSGAGGSNGGDGGSGKGGGKGGGGDKGGHGGGKGGKGKQ
jgi:hypothetical protein